VPVYMLSDVRRRMSVRALFDACSLVACRALASLIQRHVMSMADTTTYLPRGHRSGDCRRPSGRAGRVQRNRIDAERPRGGYV